MKLLNIPDYQCLKCFICYHSIIKEDKITVEFRHPFIHGETCEDDNRMFRKYISEFTQEV